MEQATACTGNFRVHKGKWFTPKGMTTQDCTYCEWCVTNGCVSMEEGYTTEDDLNLCLCDCPIKDSHASIQTYNCGKHAGVIGMGLMGRCRACFRSNATGSSAEKYCGTCSALFGICEICGVTRNNEYPMAPITKMLGKENGRGVY